MNLRTLQSLAVLGLVGIALFPSLASGSEKLDAAMLKVPPPDCVDLNGTYPVDLQVQILYQRFDIYQQLLPPLVDKKTQSFQCGNQQGTLYFFEFANIAGREQAEKFIRPLLWGTDRPTAQHPEQIEHGDGLLVVVSFPKPPNVLTATLSARLSNAVNPSIEAAVKATAVQPPLGDWQGTSTCLVKPSACHDEEALYHVRTSADGRLSMQADKIVDGKPVEMGTSDCSYEAAKKFLRCTFERGYVELTLKSDHLDGAMFLTDKTRWRDIKLEKVK